MGQYHVLANIDKRQFLHPHYFNSGVKLMEFGNDGGGIWLGLSILLADNNGAGGGDFRGTDPYALVGTWAGDRITIGGDYSDVGKYPASCHSHEVGIIDADSNIYELCADSPDERPYGAFTNISELVIETLLGGGEAVTFSPHMFTDVDRAQRCLTMAEANPYHPLGSKGGDEGFMFGKNLRPDMVIVNTQAQSATE